MKRATIAGLTWTALDATGTRWRRDRLRLYQHAHGRWVATAPGCSAVADQQEDAVKLLRSRIASAARSMGLLQKGTT